MRCIIAVVILLGVSVPCSRAAQGKGTVQEMIAELKKGEPEQLKALEALEALGEKAAEATPALIELFAQKNESVRLQAAITLGKIGAVAVAPLTNTLEAHYADKPKDATTPARFYLVWSLAFIGPSAKSATPTVVKALADPAPDVRRKAAYALGRIDAEPAKVVNALVSALADSDNDVRQTAAESLPKMSTAAVPVLIQALQTGKDELRPVAIRILGQIGAESAPAIPELKTLLLEGKTLADPAADALAGIGAKALPELTAAAASANGNVRMLAIRALHKLGAAAVPSFVDLLGSKHLDVQRQVAALLGGMQVQDKSVVIALGYTTKDKDFQVRNNALNSLRQMGSGAKLAEPYIIALLTDLDPNIRVNAFQTLQGLNIDARPGLKKALGNPDSAVRITTASLMVQLNFEVELAVPTLVEGLKEKNSDLKMQAAHALSLRGLREDEVLPIFLDGLKSATASIRRQAIESIQRYGVKAAKAAGPALINALDDADDSVCGQAMAALRIVGAQPKELFPAMVKVLRRKDTSLHQAASQIIFQVGPTAIDELVTLLKKEDAPGVRLACLQTLAMVGPPAKDALPELVKALDDPAARARMTAARALGNIGPAAKNAEDALKKAAQDADVNVQQIARAALVQIKADPNAKDFQVQGVLTPGDPFDRARQGHFHVVHTYPMKKGQRYQIDLTSPWDNYLRLENPRGDQLAQDDDGGGFPNARIIIVAPEDGWYRIIVTTYSGGASGPYTLKVK